MFFFSWCVLSSYFYIVWLYCYFLIFFILRYYLLSSYCGRWFCILILLPTLNPMSTEGSSGECYQKMKKLASSIMTVYTMIILPYTFSPKCNNCHSFFSFSFLLPPSLSSPLLSSLSPPPFFFFAWFTEC